MGVVVLHVLNPPPPPSVCSALLKRLLELEAAICSRVASNRQRRLYVQTLQVLPVAVLSSALVVLRVLCSAVVGPEEATTASLASLQCGFGSFAHSVVEGREYAKATRALEQALKRGMKKPKMWGK